MRKRNVQILFRLTEEEAEHLNELVRKSGRSKEAFLREMVRGYQLCEKPDPEFYKMMREKKPIRTSLVNAALAKEQIGALLAEGKDVLYVGFSSGLSGTFQSVSIAMEELKEEYPDRKILAVDTLAAAVGQGLLV